MSPLVLFGAGGFLGQHVLRELSSRALDVVCLGRQPIADAVFHSCDVRKSERVTELLDLLSPSRIVNCAALSRVADCLADPVTARLVNRDFPEALGEWCAQRGTRLVHVSTDIVFAGDAPSGGYLEQAEAQPVSEYGCSKLAGEVALLAAQPKALVVRLPLLFGDSFSRELGASDSLLAAVRRGDRPGLFTDEWRTPLEVGDAARALGELSEGEQRGVLHLAGSERVTRFELGELVLAAHGLQLDSIRARERGEVATNEARPRDVSLNSDDARQLITGELRGPRTFFA